MIGGRWYILDAERHPVKCRDLMAWARWMEESRADDRTRVAHTEITTGEHVSTVFLGLDHRFGGEGPPILFETMVFGGPHDGEMQRYATWDDAETGHKVLVGKLRREAKVKP